MKLIFFVVILFIASTSCQNKSKDEVHILKPGIGYDNFIIDITTLNDITSYYGDIYFVDTVNWGAPFDSTQIFCINYSYDLLGVSFSFYPDSKSIFGISLKPPFHGKTDKDIILGESTFKEIISAYGDTKWSYIGNMINDPIALVKCYEGICFYQNFSEPISVEDSLLNNYLDNKVTEITIVKSTWR